MVHIKHCQSMLRLLADTNPRGHTQHDSCMFYLQAMMATRQSYAAEEAAGRVLPCVAPLAVDPVPEVRHAALATLEAFMKLLQEHSATRDSAAGPSDAAGGTQQVYPCMIS